MLTRDVVGVELGLQHRQSLDVLTIGVAIHFRPTSLHFTSLRFTSINTSPHSSNIYRAVSSITLRSKQ
jgi:hypothetical protein